MYLIYISPQPGSGLKWETVREIPVPGPQAPPGPPRASPWASPDFSLGPGDPLGSLRYPAGPPQEPRMSIETPKVSPVLPQIGPSDRNIIKKRWFFNDFNSDLARLKTLLMTPQEPPEAPQELAWDPLALPGAPQLRPWDVLGSPKALSGTPREVPGPGPPTGPSPGSPLGLPGLLRGPRGSPGLPPVPRRAAPIETPKVSLWLALSS